MHLHLLISNNHGRIDRLIVVEINHKWCFSLHEMNKELMKNVHFCSMLFDNVLAEDM